MSVYSFRSNFSRTHSQITTNTFSQFSNRYKSYVIHSNSEVLLQVKCIKDIGSGTFANVFAAYVKILPTKYSLDEEKIQILAIKRSDRNGREREIHSLLSDRHRNILSLKYHFNYATKNGIKQCLVMELMPESLYNLIQRLRYEKIILSNETRKYFMFSLLSALDFMHSRRFGHRDIKSLNILVDIDQDLIKIADFGCSKLIESGSSNAVNVGSRYYRAPELLCKNQMYNLSIDIWSMAIVFMEMILFDVIFKGENETDQLIKIFEILGVPNDEEQKIMNCEIKIDNIEIPEKKLHLKLGIDENDKLLPLLYKMLDYNLNKRISANDCLIYCTSIFAIVKENKDSKIKN